MPPRLDKPLKRELEHEGKLYTVTVSPDGVRVAAKGRRKGHELTWDALLSGEAELRRDLIGSIEALRAKGRRAGGRTGRRKSSRR
jgi:hypothetical protein